MNILAHITTIIIEIILFLLIVRLKNATMCWVAQLRDIQEKQEKNVKTLVEMYDDGRLEDFLA